MRPRSHEMFAPCLRPRLRCFCILLAAAIGSVPHALRAAIANGTFDGITFGPPSTIPGWSHLGHTPLLRPDDPGDPFNGFAPLGNAVAVMDTDDAFSAGEILGVSPGAVETALSMPAGSIAALGSLPTHGAVIWQTFAAEAGATLTFQYNHISYDEFYLFVDGHNDFSFAYLSAPGGGGGTLTLLGDSNTLTSVPNSLDIIPAESGMKVFNSGPLAGGTYTLGLGVFNSESDSASSFLLVDNVRLDAQAIPETQAWLMLGVVVAGGAAACACGRCCGRRRPRS